jgi:hypothetical protein
VHAVRDGNSGKVLKRSFDTLKDGGMLIASDLYIRATAPEKGCGVGFLKQALDGSDQQSWFRNSF